MVQIIPVDPVFRAAIEEAGPGDRLIVGIENDLKTNRERAIPDRYWYKF